MGMVLTDKSRKEKRKEARLSKKLHKHQSWLEMHKSRKVKNDKRHSTTEKFSGDKRETEISLVESDDERDDWSNEPSTTVAAEFKVGSKALKRKKKEIQRKKTKFEEYLELVDGPSAEKDLEMERILEKKLKVKSGKLKDESDGLDSLFEGLESLADSFEQESDQVYDDGRKDTKSVVDKLAKKKKSKKRELDIDIYGNPLNKKQCVDNEVLGSRDNGGEHDELQNHVDTHEIHSAIKYVPPYLRSRLKGESEDHLQIRRWVRGRLNRLSESNVESLTGEVFTIFQSVSRSTASQILSHEVLASFSGGPRGNDQHAAVFASFVAGMACMAGIDFGAKLVASLAKCFEEEYKKEDNLSLRNLSLLLSYLCIFGVCSSELIYGFLHKLSEQLTEIDVSTILDVLNCCGMTLRRDDPAAMKSFIVGVQSKVNELKANSGDDRAKENNKRMEFMLETIFEIKNNKRKAKDDTPQHLRMKKWLQKLRVDDVVLRGITWSKLLDPNKKGQWWLSGDMASGTVNVEEVADRIDTGVHEVQKLLQLAASQRMNTDTRRSIFLAIMNGEDHDDTFQQLLGLNLPGKQDREIMRVLLNNCLQEKVFNKYYTGLAIKLCSHDKNHKFTLQFCIWDQFKELESMSLMQSMHFAKFVAEMIASFTLSLAVLKTANLSDAKLLTPKRIMHFRMLFDSILDFPEDLVWNIFTRIAITPEFEDLRNGIEFFIGTYVVTANASAGSKFKLAKKALNNGEGILR